MALTNEPQALSYAKSFSTSAPTRRGYEKASSTWKQGSPLQDDGSGYLTPPTSPVDGSAVGKRLLGVALADASGTTGADVIMVSPDNGTVFEGTLSDATAGTHTLAQADMHKIFPLTKGSTNWYLDANAASNNGAQIIGFKDPIGTVDGRVYFVMTRATMGGVAASSGTL